MAQHRFETTARRFSETVAHPPIQADPPAFVVADSVALAYWREHFPLLTANGTLSPADLGAFALLCRLWSQCTLAEGRELRDAMGRFQQYAKQFGLTPLARKTLGAGPAQQEGGNDLGI